MRKCKDCDGLNAGNWSATMGYSIAYPTFLNLAYAKGVSPDFYFTREKRRSCTCWKAQTVYGVLEEEYRRFHLGLTPKEKKRLRVYGPKYLEALRLISSKFEITP
jgi:hypothetical protein